MVSPRLGCRPSTDDQGVSVGLGPPVGVVMTVKLGKRWEEKMVGISSRT